MTPLPPNVIYFILIQSCIWGIWFVDRIAPLRSAPLPPLRWAYSMIYITYQVSPVPLLSNLKPRSPAEQLGLLFIPATPACQTDVVVWRGFESSVLETRNTPTLPLVC